MSWTSSRLDRDPLLLSLQQSEPLNVGVLEASETGPENLEQLLRD